MYESKDSACGGLTRGLKRFASVLLLFIACATAAADKPLNDAVDRSDPNFVKAYLLMADPGGELYSCAGHSALRLVCDAYKLDFCYSYESEMVSERVLTFLAGRLKMGMFAIPTAKYLSFYRNDHRGMRQYPLLLPLDVKKRLCKIMDDKVKEGVSLPYDFLKRGCAQSDLQCLIEAVKPLTIDFGTWPAHLRTQTRREIFSSVMECFPWNGFFVDSLVGAEGDEMVSVERKVVLPKDLLALLRQAKVLGKPVLVGDGEELLKEQPITASGWFSPCVAGTFVFLLSFLGMMKGGVGRIVRGLLYALYVPIAVFYTYLVSLSNVPATSWHWLVVPFNILPIVFWKWREKWLLPFTGGLILWMAGMLVAPHRLIDSAYYPLVAAYVVLGVTLAPEKCFGTLCSTLKVK